MGIIHVAQYLHGFQKALQTAPIDDPEIGALFLVQEHEQDRAQQYLENSIVEFKRLMRTNLKYSNPDMVERNDAKIIVAFVLYELGKIFSTSALAKLRLRAKNKYQ